MANDLGPGTFTHKLVTPGTHTYNVDGDFRSRGNEDRRSRLGEARWMERPRACSGVDFACRGSTLDGRRFLHLCVVHRVLSGKRGNMGFLSNRIGCFDVIMLHTTSNGPGYPNQRRYFDGGRNLVQQSSFEEAQRGSSAAWLAELTKKSNQMRCRVVRRE